MTSLQTVIELNSDTFIVVTAPPGAAVRHYKNAATQTSVDAQVPSLVANRLDPAPRALSPPPQGDEMVSQTFPSPPSSRSTTGVRGSAPSTTSDIEDPSSPRSDNIALAQQSDARPPVHKPASSPSQALEPTPSPTPTTALPVPGPVPTTQIATFGFPGLSLGTSEVRGPQRPTGRAILQDTSRPNQSPSFPKPNASIFARSSIGQSSLQAANDSTAVATAVARHKRTYSFAVSSSKVQSSSDLPTSQAKRAKLETAGSFVREPAPFPMDVEAARRARNELRREDQFLAPKITIPDPAKMMCVAGDFVLRKMNNRIFPYEIAELIVNTDEWRLEPYDQIVPAVTLPSQILGDTEAFSLQIQTFPHGLHQAASVLWPSDEVLPMSDWSPEGDELYNRLLMYRGFVLRHLMETPETSPFRCMVADWFDSLKASPRAANETSTFEFADKAMTSRSDSDISLPRLLSPRHDAIIEEVNGTLTQELRNVYGSSVGAATQSGPARVILSFVLLAIQLSRPIPELVHLFHTGRVRRLPRYEKLWSEYKRAFGPGPQLLMLRVADPMIKSSLYIVE